MTKRCSGSVFPVEPDPGDAHGLVKPTGLDQTSPDHQVTDLPPILQFPRAAHADHDVQAMDEDTPNELGALEAPVCIQTGPTVALGLAPENWTG